MSRFSALTNSFSSHPFIGATRQRAGSEHDARHYPRVAPDRDVRDPRRGRDIAPELRGRHVGSRRLRRRRQLDGGQVYSIEERNLHRGRHLRWIRVHLLRRDPGTHVRKGIRRDDVHGDHVVVHRHDAHRRQQADGLHLQILGRRHHTQSKYTYKQHKSPQVAEATSLGTCPSTEATAIASGISWMSSVTRVNPQFKCIANCAAQPVDSCADPSPPPPPPSPPPLADDDDAATGIRIVSALLGTVLALLIQL